MLGNGGKMRGAYTIDEIEELLYRMGIPFDWVETTWFTKLFYPYLDGVDMYVYALFDRYQPENHVLDFECRYAGEEGYFIYVDDKKRLLTGLLYKYEKMLQNVAKCD